MPKREQRRPPELDRVGIPPSARPGGAGSGARGRKPVWPLVIALAVLAAAGVFLALRIYGGAAPAVPAAMQTPQSAQGEVQTAEQADLEETGAGSGAESLSEAELEARGNAYIAWLAAQPEFEGLNLTVWPNLPYLIMVNRAAGTLTVYVEGTDGRYSLPYCAMVCSAGEETPTGIFTTSGAVPDPAVEDGSHGQYATCIWDSYLFQSVPCSGAVKNAVDAEQFAALGEPVSDGSVLLLTCDAKWIRDNCPIGTPVIIYDNAEDAGPLGRAEGLTVQSTDAAQSGWDPTDPDPANPWGEEYRDGTALRTARAADEWVRYVYGGLREDLTDWPVG